jgi:hypothetical protein
MLKLYSERYNEVLRASGGGRPSMSSSLWSLGTG